MKVSAYLLFGLLCLATAPAVAADAFLSQLVGDWVGRGAMRQNPTAATERLFCKVSNRLSEDGMSLVQTGRCSLASNSGPIDGAITALGENVYSGLLSSLASRQPATLNGALVEMTHDKDGKLQLPTKATKAADKVTVLAMNAEYVDKLSGQLVKSVNTLEVLPEGYSLTATRINPADGTEYTSSQIVFTQK